MMRGADRLSAKDSCSSSIDGDGDSVAGSAIFLYGCDGSGLQEGIAWR
jgi:hypothetical protein